MSPRPIILVIDDEEGNRRLFSRQVTHLGHTCVVASNGREAWGIISTATPDLIMLDIDMPEMNGITLLKKLKESETYRHIPVIMISGIDEMKTVVRCIEMGAEDYLVKPPNLILLKARISSGLEKKRLHDSELQKLLTLESFSLQLQHRVSEKSQQLSNAYLDTLNRLVIAAEFKDEDTADHLHRMSRYSALLAEKAGLGTEEVKNILYAAPLHDVGKIGVPDSVLLKRGKLTEQEFEMMKKHTLIGSHILANSQAEIVQLAHQIVLTHHEKWDGSGYPNGISTEKIPLIGRIVAIADNFDALTSKRPYKDPYPIKVACEILMKGKAKHFDPDLVEIFLKNISDVVQIKREIDGPESLEENEFSWSERDGEMISKRSPH